MLYELHEMQHSYFAPIRFAAQTVVSIYGHPISPLSYSPISRAIAAGSELILRTTQRYDKPAFNLPTTVFNGETVNVVEEVVIDKPFCELRHFRKEGVKKDGPIVLIVAPLSGHYATLLRDTVRGFLQHHDVYITDWKDAKTVPLSQGDFGFDDYVLYVREFLEHFNGKAHVVSVCQPTVPVLVAVSLMAADKSKAMPRSMVMMGGPIDARRSPTSVNTFATEHTLDWFVGHLIYHVPSKYPGYARRVYPGFLQHTGFIAMNPGRHVASHRDFFYKLIQGDGESVNHHKTFYDEYNAVMDLPAAYYLETIVRVFQQQSLPKGELESCGKKVDPSLIKQTALLTVEGELDDISGNGQTEAAHDLCTGIPADRHLHITVPDVGHYGIFSGRRFREVIYPQLAHFIAQFD